MLMVGICLGGEVRESVFSVFTGYYPSSWTQIGQLEPGTSIKVTLSTTLPGLNIRFALRSGPNIFSAGADDNSVRINSYTHSLETTVTEA